MKKLASMLMLLVLVVSMAVAGAVSAFATVTELPADWNPTDYEYIVVGNEGLLGDYAWQPTNEAFKMKYDETAGIWYLNLNGVANEGKDFDIFNSPLYRVVAVGYNKENPMELSFTKLGVAQDDRDYSDVYFDPSGDMKAHTLTITFDGQKASGFLDSPYVELPMAEESEYYLTGSAPLFAPVWSPSCEDYLMTKGNDNTYSLEISVTKDMWNSDIEYNVAKDGVFDENANARLHIEENTASIIFVFNSETKTIETRPVVNDESQLNEPTEHSTEASTDEATAVTADNPTDATNPTNAITATTNTTATTATGATVKPAIASTSEGKPENGAGGIIAIAVGVIILAGAGVVIIGKKKAK